MKWYVVTPPYEQGHADTCSLEPPEWGCDVVEVEAPTKRTAKVVGPREMRCKGMKWQHLMYEDCQNPFKGLKVEPVEEARDA